MEMALRHGISCTLRTPHTLSAKRLSKEQTANQSTSVRAQRPRFVRWLRFCLSSAEAFDSTSTDLNQSARNAGYSIPREPRKSSGGWLTPSFETDSSKQ